MDNQIKTSFIPRKSIDATVSVASNPQPKARAARTIFSIIATIIFLGVIAGAVFTFVWQIKLKKDILNQVAVMQEARKSFEDSFINNASRLNTRIEESYKMLQNHVSPSTLYSLLEEYTLQTVAFSSFSFKDNLDGSISVSGSGEAARYESIVLQSDAFGKSGYLRNVIFTNLQPDANSNHIGFSFEATLDPKLVFYSRSLTPSNNNPN